MNIFFNIIAVFLIINGIRNLLSCFKHRAASDFLLMGKLEIPFWLLKAGASIFIIALGIFVIMM